MEEATLLTAELAYVLTTIGADAALGVDNARLFPKKKADRDRLLEAGHESLMRHEWIAESKDGGEKLDEDLVLVVDTLANPNFVITTEIREHPKAPPKRLIHYVTNSSIVEQVFLGREGYRLTKVHELTLALFRINRAIGVPAKNRVGEHAVKLNKAVFAKMKKSVDKGDAKKVLPAMKKVGLDDVAAKAALVSMATPRTCGTVEILEIKDHAIVDANAFAYFIGEGGCWVVMQPDISKNDMFLRTFDETQLWGLMARSLGDLVST